MYRRIRYFLGGYKQIPGWRRVPAIFQAATQFSGLEDIGRCCCADGVGALAASVVRQHRSVDDRSRILGVEPILRLCAGVDQAGEPVAVPAASLDHCG